MGVQILVSISKACASPNQKVLGLFVPRSALRIATERRKLSGFSRQHIICCSLLFYPTQPSSHTVESAIFSAVSCLISLLRGVVWIPSASSSYAGVLELLRCVCISHNFHLALARARCTAGVHTHNQHADCAHSIGVPSACCPCAHRPLTSSVSRLRRLTRVRCCSRCTRGAESRRRTRPRCSLLAVGWLRAVRTCRARSM